ncbi:MAG TPA: sulfatase-like hydrolase/transferase [Terracidiphilus sp.]|nr:sulfatase-like hydrolase/transferase [Terracidiphilus sp.]
MIKRIAQAWGFAAIVLLPGYIDLTSSLGDERMHVPWPLTRLVLGQLIDLAIVGFVFAGILAILRRLKAWQQIRWFVLALFPVYLLVCNLRIFPFRVSYSLVVMIAIVWFAVLAAVIFRAPLIAAKLYAFGSAVLSGAVVFAVVMTAQLVSVAFWHPGIQAFSGDIPSEPANRPRLVWIIFDELAYMPVFEDRDATLDLPNFDRLRSQSTVYSDVTPIGYHTRLVVPSLLLGRVVIKSTITAQNRFLVRTVDDPHWEPFDASASVFGFARQLGVTSTIVGWYLPYCSIFAGAATDCYWSNDDTEDGAPPAVNANLGDDVWFPLRVAAEQLIAPRAAVDDVAHWESLSHVASVEDIGQHALNALADNQADMIYLHLPTPHPPAFWNRRSHRFGVGGSYLDSLDYSDRLLGQILDTLEAQPRWAHTTLVIQGDHSWRTGIWRTAPGWSEEDERISKGGQWDPRPLVLIHAAGQTNAVTVASPTSLMYVHDFVVSQIQVLGR